MSRKSGHRSCEICGVKEAHLESPRFFACFPLDEVRCREWVRVTGNTDLVHVPIEKLHCNKHICVEHFKKSHINKKKTRLKKRAVPCLNLRAPPLSEDQMSGFPLHVWKKQVPSSTASTNKVSVSVTLAQPEEIHVSGSTASTSKDSVSVTVAKPEEIHGTTASTSKDSVSVTLAQPEEIHVSGSTASTSKDSVSVTVAKPEEIHVSGTTASTSKDSVSVTLAQPEEIHEYGRKNASTPVQMQSKGIKRQFEEEELTPRKRKLVERLVKSNCTIKALKKNSILIEKIESPVLKELVVNTVKNQKRKPKGRRWTTKHKLACLAILKRSPKTYRYLSAAMALPTTKTLQNILKRVPMTTGINKSVITHLKSIAQDLDERDKIVNLAFDEMALKSRLIYNELKDTVEGYEDLGEFGRTKELADHALVFLIQGVRKKFKQPIAFYLTKGTISSAKLAMQIKKIVRELTECGYTVLNTVCDQGPTNTGALRILREASGPLEDASNHYFKIGEKKVYIVYDVPHLFKSMRNNFLNGGIVNLDGTKGHWRHLVDVELLNRRLLYLSKITQAHVKPKYKQKMRVKLAAQALSTTVAAVLKLMSRAEVDPNKAEELNNTAQVVGELDELFDITNGPSGPQDIKKGRRQNVSEKSTHMEKWVAFIRKLRNTQFLRRDVKLNNVKCIEGYITTLKSLRDIWQRVKAENIKYLNLRNLNQDALENLFGVIRQHSPTNRNPTATHFMAALKTAVVTGLTAPHSRGANCEKDQKVLLTNFNNLIFSSDERVLLSQEGNTHSTDTADKENESPETELIVALPEEEEVANDFTLLDNQPTVYVAGYLAKQILKKANCTKCEENLTVKAPGDNPIYSYIYLREWWQNKFSLTYPSQTFCDTIKYLVELIEGQILPQLNTNNICQLAYALCQVACPNSCFTCEVHGSDLKEKCIKTTCKMLIRRQCHRVNQNLAHKEDNLADANKRAEQQGRAK